MDRKKREVLIVSMRNHKFGLPKNTKFEGLKKPLFRLRYFLNKTKFK